MALQPNHGEETVGQSEPTYCLTACAESCPLPTCNEAHGAKLRVGTCHDQDCRALERAVGPGSSQAGSPKPIRIARCWVCRHLPGDTEFGVQVLLDEPGKLVVAAVDGLIISRSERTSQQGAHHVADHY